MPLVHLYGNPVATGTKTYDLDLKISDWQHRITATMGFDTASFNVQQPKHVLEDLFASALGCRVVRYSPDGHFIIWEGYIAEMALTLPGVTMRISIRDMYNRVYVRYIAIDTSANPPTESAEASTAAVNDTVSQGQYGIKELTFTPRVNRIINTNATGLATIILNEFAQPKRAQNIQSGIIGIGLAVKCEGYMHTLGWRKYNQTAVSATQDADNEIGDIVTSVGQFVKSTALDNNGLAVEKYFNRDQSALDIIQAIAALGDATNRWLAFMLEGRKLYYQQASTTIAYTRRVIDGRQEFFDLQNRNVPYYEIRPNRWLRTTDVYPHNLNPADLRDDFQASYIESVDWSEPDTIQLAGSQGDDPQIFVARVAARGNAVV